MKRAFVVYTESSEKVAFSGESMIIPAKESMTLEFIDPSHVEKILQLFPKDEINVN